MSKAYATRAHQAHPSGAALASLLSLPELDGLLHLQRRNVESLTRIRDAVSQEHALAEQRSQRQLFKTEHGYDDDHAGMYQEEFKGGGGFAGADAKKRRGVGFLALLSQFPFHLVWTFPLPVLSAAVANTFHLAPCRRRPHPAGVTVATEPKLPNGVVDPMVPVPSATPVACTMLSSHARWGPIRHRLWDRTCGQRAASTRDLQHILSHLLAMYFWCNGRYFA